MSAGYARIAFQTTKGNKQMTVSVEILGVEIPALVIVWGFSMLFLVALMVAINIDNKKEGN